MRLSSTSTMSEQCIWNQRGQSIGSDHRGKVFHHFHMTSGTIFKTDSAKTSLKPQALQCMASPQWYLYIFSLHTSWPPPQLSFSRLSSHTFETSRWAAGSTSDAFEDKRETPDCRGEGSHPWHRSLGFWLFMVGTNCRSANSLSSSNSSRYKSNRGLRHFS